MSIDRLLALSKVLGQEQLVARQVHPPPFTLFSLSGLWRGCHQRHHHRPIGGRIFTSSSLPGSTACSRPDSTVDIASVGRDNIKSAT